VHWHAHRKSHLVTSLAPGIKGDDVVGFSVEPLAGVKFAVPTIFSGKVYAGTSKSVAGFGL
jgi:hypothetical protein